MNRGPLPILSVLDDVVVGFDPGHSKKPPHHRFMDWVHHHGIGVFALLFLLVAASAIEVGSLYWKAHITLAATSSQSKVVLPPRPIKGPNIVVYSRDLSQSIKVIDSQPINLTVADKPITISPDSIKGWLQINTDKSKGVSYIHVSKDAITKSLNKAAAPYIKAPLNQVSVTHSDGSAFVIASGRDGTKLADVSSVTTQIGDNLLSAKGMQLILPTETQAFGTSTAADFAKLIEVNVVSKQMYLYDKGVLTYSYPISAGAPATPTPIGQYKIYEKLAIQDMRGFNADGTRYFQPSVRYVNYFKQGGYAIHGNYWRPLSWFGVYNSSHGCVSLPENQAKVVYDWAPIGTTVITHY